MKKSVEVLMHLIFWVIVVCGFYGLYAYLVASVAGMFGGMVIINFKNFFLVSWAFLPVFILNFYVFYSVLIPRFFHRKGRVKFILLSLGTILGAILLNLAINFIMDHGRIDLLEVIGNSSILFIISGVLGCLLKGSILWIRSVAERKALKKKHLESKTALLLLKAQLNPHFLFNSLNNIDVLIEENPKTASEYLKMLCDILRYVLYETKEDETELAKEIAQIESYIDLQKIRTTNPRYVTFNITGELKAQKIAPMIFLPFVENAFKHSRNKAIDKAIEIEFEVHEHSVKMVCRNYFEDNQPEVMQNEGLGIETIKQRLLLLYPGIHELIIEKNDHWFHVTLCIQLKDGN